MKETTPTPTTTEPTPTPAPCCAAGLLREPTELELAQWRLRAAEGHIAYLERENTSLGLYCVAACGFILGLFYARYL